MKDHYKALAKHYDLLSRWYSLGRIDHCRNAYLAEITEAVRSNSNLRVCYVGAGHGREAIKAAEAGAMVTVVDVSESMLGVFQSYLMTTPEYVQDRVMVEHQDVSQFSERLEDGEKYDWVIANFFLNILDKSELENTLGALFNCCSDKGSLVISDFHLDSGHDGNILTRFLQRIHWYCALIIFRLWVKNTFHPIYDYSVILKDSGWKISQTKKFGFLGMRLYHSVRVNFECRGRLAEND